MNWIGRILTDYGTDLENEPFRGMLVDLKITRELTTVDGPKSRSRVGAKDRAGFGGSEWWDFGVSEKPLRHHVHHSRVVPCGHLSWSVRSGERMPHHNGRSERGERAVPGGEAVYGRWRGRLVLPSMTPGFRHRNRQTKMDIKGER